MTLDKEVVAALIGIVPGVLAGLALLILVLVFRKPIIEHVIPNLGGLKIFGLEITLLKKSLDDAAVKTNVSMSEGDKWSALKRAQRVMPVLRGARVLWVDDDRRGNHQLRKILSSFKVQVDQAADTDEALKLLQRHEYHAVISDIKRGSDARAGIEMVERMWAQNIYRWTIFYVRTLRPGLPDHAFAITNRPDHLLHYLMDILERERWE
jgi:CheY-like chemotaxis protein